MIRRIQALHYRAFQYIDVKLSDFLILIGPNASGKSTFLDGINLIQDILNLNPQRAIEKRTSRFHELLWKQSGNKFELAFELAIPAEIKTKLKDKDFSLARYEIALQFDNEKGIIISGENLWLTKEGVKNNDGSDFHQFSLFPAEPKEPEYLVSARKKIPVGWRKVISKSAQGNDYFKSENTEWNIIYKFGPLKASLSGMPEDPERFPVALWVKSFFMEGVQFLQLNSSKMRWPCRPDAPVSFQTDGSNLPKVVQYLKEKHQRSFARWISHIQTALPEIAAIETRERAEDRFLYLTIKHKNGMELPSWVISDGTLRLLAQTIIAYLPEKNRIYMIEEPENGLHPLAIESIFQSLSSVYDNQILLATHSPAILRLAEPSQILCFSKTLSGAVDIVNGENHPKLREWQKGVDLSTLHAAGVLQ